MPCIRTLKEKDQNGGYNEIPLGAKAENVIFKNGNPLSDFFPPSNDKLQFLVAENGWIRWEPLSRAEDMSF